MASSRTSTSTGSGPAKPVLDVPAYFLYGEDWTAETFGFFHIEPFSVRNIPNRWQISSHRHPDFDQFSILFSGNCSFEHDGQSQIATGPCCVFTPADVVHQFRYQPNTLGYVISVSPDFAPGLAFDEAAVKKVMLQFATARLIPLESGAALDSIERLIGLINEKFNSSHAYRRDAIRYLFAACVLELGAALAGNPALASVPAKSTSNTYELFQRFRRRVDADIGRVGISGDGDESLFSVEAFAAHLSTTPYALNAACRRVSGRSARELVQAAMLGQATRLLLYTTRPIKEISYCLGYSHPSHFGRFFKQNRGMTPAMFRQQYTPLACNEAEDRSTQRSLQHR